MSLFDKKNQQIKALNNTVNQLTNDRTSLIQQVQDLQVQINKVDTTQKYQNQLKYNVNELNPLQSNLIDWGAYKEYRFSQLDSSKKDNKDLTSGYVFYLKVLEKVRYFNNAYKVTAKNGNEQSITTFMYAVTIGIFHGCSAIYFGEQNTLKYGSALALTPQKTDLSGQVVQGKLQSLSFGTTGTDYVDFDVYEAVDTFNEQAPAEQVAVFSFNLQRFGIWALGYLYLSKVIEYLDIVNLNMNWLRKKMTREVRNANTAQAELLSLLDNSPVIDIQTKEGDEFNVYRPIEMTQSTLDEIWSGLSYYEAYWDRIIGIRSEASKPAEKSARALSDELAPNTLYANKSTDDFIWRVKQFALRCNELWSDLYDLEIEEIESDNKPDTNKGAQAQELGGND